MAILEKKRSIDELEADPFYYTFVELPTILDKMMITVVPRIKDIMSCLMPSEPFNMP
jgi:hypothetical protein